MNEFLAVVCIFVGGGLVSLMWWLAELSEIAYLKRKALPEQRTPARIGGEFYYIVPAAEYVDLQGVRIAFLHATRDKTLSANPYAERRAVHRES